MLAVVLLAAALFLLGIQSRIGVFELRADARAKIASVHDAIQAERDFWLADADLRMATVGTPTPSAMAGPAGPAAGSAAGH